MHHTCHIVLLVCLLRAAAPAQLHAQFNTKQDKVWIFGPNAGIDFTSGTAVPLYWSPSGNYCL